MKTFQILLFTFLTHICYSQCSQNTILGSTINEFDWTTESFNIWFKIDNSPPKEANIPSPFSGIDNSTEFNTGFLAEQLDNSPEDGWEIIYYNFGSEDFGVGAPYFRFV